MCQRSCSGGMQNIGKSVYDNEIVKDMKNYVHTGTGIERFFRIFPNPSSNHHEIFCWLACEGVWPNTSPGARLLAVDQVRLNCIVKVQSRSVLDIGLNIHQGKAANFTKRRRRQEVLQTEIVFRFLICPRRNVSFEIKTFFLQQEMTTPWPKSLVFYL